MAVSPHESETGFSIGADGTVRGDDGHAGRLAASLGYAARLADQVEYLLDIGALEALTTVSAEGITARVVRDDAGGLGLSVVVTTQQHPAARVFTIVGGADLDTALIHCLGRVQQAPGVRWSAVITDDKRLVATSPQPPGATLPDPGPAVANVGVRGLAVLQAIDERLRESWVQLTYTRGTLLLAAVETHCLYAVVDDVDPLAFAEAIEETRAILGSHDLRRAATLQPAIATPPAPTEDEALPAHVPPVIPAPVGMRYRAPQPRTKTTRRGLFAR